MMRFTTATTLPILLLLLSTLFGGWWIVASLTYMTGLVFFLDTVIQDTAGTDTDAEFPAGDALLIAIGCAHFPLMALVVWSLVQQPFSLAEDIALFMASGLFFGQIGNSTAHELIHRPKRWLHRLGMWMYVSLLFGHHTSAHVLVHHRHVATDADPSSSKLGESYYAFALRAWIGSFALGYLAEKERLSKIGGPASQNPYVVYCLGAFGFLLIAYQSLGLSGLATFAALALYATAQLLLSDYVQHYGLRRGLQDGKAEPVNNTHSWNSPHPFSSAMMLNAPRHSDHHARPSKTFPKLEIPDGSPTLPRSLPTMATLALFPTLWRRVMDPRALKWQR